MLAVGARLPGWMATGVVEYLRRFDRDSPVRLIEIPAAGRSRQRVDRGVIQAREAAAIRARLPKRAYVAALDERGQAVTTAALAQRLAQWRLAGRPVALLLGGADGLSPALCADADWVWSLSAHTLPHGLARVVLMEQLYRAWSMSRGHPYHRAG